MTIGKYSSSAMVGISLILSSAASFADEQNNLTSVAEYRQMSQNDAYEIVMGALATVYNHYSQVQPDAYIANCILDLFNNPDHPRPNGYDHLEIGISVVNAGNNADKLSVQHVLLGVVNRQCRK